MYDQEQQTYYDVESAVTTTCGDKAYDIILAIGAVRQLVHEWRLCPTIDLNERETQSRLSAFLRDRFTRVNKGFIMARHSVYAGKRHMETYPFSRICCEAYVKPKENERAMRVDVVVWDDEPQETIFMNYGAYPILFASEIKSKSGISQLNENRGDKSRLLSLLKTGIAKCSCCIQLVGVPTETSRVHIAWNHIAFKELDSVMVLCTATTKDIWEKYGAKMNELDFSGGI